MKIICITELLDNFTFGKEYEPLDPEAYKVKIPEGCILLINDSDDLDASYPWFFKTPEEFAMIPTELFKMLDRKAVQRNDKASG